MRSLWLAIAVWGWLPLPVVRPGGEREGRLPEYLAPFVPSPMKVVEAMLRLAKVTSKDVVYDLGCGDGRIVITAAKKFGAKGVGVDIDYQRVKEAMENAKRQGVEDRVTILLKDAFDVDLSEATVVTLYLLSEANLKLRPKLLAELKPGARVVSHQFDMGSWRPDRTVEVKDESGWTRRLYLWVIKPPAPASGMWEWKEGRAMHRLKVRQIGSAISGFYITPEGRRLPLEDAFLSGDEIHFVVGGERRRVYEGRVRGDSIIGWVRAEAEGRKGRWQAKRLKVRVGGKWAVSIQAPWGRVKGTLFLRGIGGRLSGALEVMGRKFPVSGDLFGATARVEVRFPTPLGEALMRLEGLVDGDRMDGPIRIEPFKVRGWFEGRREGD